MRPGTPLKPLARMSSDQLAAIVDGGKRRPHDSAEYLRARAAQQELYKRTQAAWPRPARRDLGSG